MIKILFYALLAFVSFDVCSASNYHQNIAESRPRSLELQEITDIDRPSLEILKTNFMRLKVEIEDQSPSEIYQAVDRIIRCNYLPGYVDLMSQCLVNLQDFVEAYKGTNDNRLEDMNDMRNDLKNLVNAMGWDVDIINRFMTVHIPRAINIIDGLDREI